MKWFEQLTGFKEGSYTDTQAALSVVNGRLQGRGIHRGASIGTLTLPSLSDLRIATTTVRGAGRPQLSIVQGDVRAMHRRPENQGALFQV